MNIRQKNFPDILQEIEKMRKKRQFPLALQMVVRELNNDPTNHALLHVKGILERQCGYLDSAEASLLYALEKDPRNSQVLVSLANFYLRDNQFDLAWDYVTQAHEINRKEPYTLNTAGNIATAQGDFKKAETFYAASLRVKRDDLVTLNSLAKLYIISDRIDKATEVLESIIENSEKYSQNDLFITYNYFARCSIAQGEYGQAKYFACQADKIDDSNSDNHLLITISNIAMACKESNQQKAIQLIDEAFSMSMQFLKRQYHNSWFMIAAVCGQWGYRTNMVIEQGQYYIRKEKATKRHLNNIVDAASHQNAWQELVNRAVLTGLRACS